MRKAQKKQAEEFTDLLEQAQGEIKELVETGKTLAAMDLLVQCQEGAVQLGELIEKTEGEDCTVIPILENYCELIYHIHEELSAGVEINPNKIHKRLHRQLIQIKNRIRNDIKVRYEMVFLPYKASMWDSLESVWQAADADPDCDAYVVPIPYYDKNPDGSLGAYHYEGNSLPSNVPVVHYDTYSFENRKPDAIYIHNPYDYANHVTTIEPRFYSEELKKYTECLVYIPYYATSGGMAEGQMQCPAYYHADYIIIQAEKYRQFFDPALPAEKLVPLGSPKFDRVIHMCENPPQPPEEWKEKMAGRKVYFYNTSIQGMLGNTEAFLKKMEYVFNTFRGREDACLLWRPHPLLESTFESMRKPLKPVYDGLKSYFVENNVGIYDDTPDITCAIAFCHAYIGDAATSVTSLFGMAGKPLFILNNTVHRAPGKDDWRGEIIKRFFPDISDMWMITQGNKLYYSPNNNYEYEYYCELSEYSYGDYYADIVEIGGKVYACPANAQDILVLDHGKIERRICLTHYLEEGGAFVCTWHIGDYLFLIPLRYPAIVRYDTVHDKISYIKDYHDVFVKFVNGEWRIGGSCVWKDYLMIASPTEPQVVAIDIKSCKAHVLALGVKHQCGCAGLMPDKLSKDDDIWMLPYTGKVITQWNPQTGEVREYSDFPASFKCINRPHGYECEDRPFHTVAFYKKYIIFPPNWGNMFLRLDKETGEITEWKPPMPIAWEEKNGYYSFWGIGAFAGRTDTLGEGTYRFNAIMDRKLFHVNLESGAYKEIPIRFNQEDLRRYEPGFGEISEWLQYACLENAINPLGKFLDGDIAGNLFDRTRQIRAYEKIAVNNDGTSGKKIYRFVREKLSI